MTQKVGGVEFSVEVDASGVSSASQSVQSDLREVEESFKKASSGASRLSGSAKKTGGSLSGLGKNAGQAGIQIQQFVGQIQGGQSALLALSQQGADLGIVLGKAGLGAAVGIAATALSFLIPALTGAEEKTSSLRDRIKELGDEIELTSNQIKFLGRENSKAADEMSEANVKAFNKIRDLREELEKMQSAGTGLDTGQFAVPRSAEENQRRYAQSIKETEERIADLETQIDTNSQTVKKLADETANLGNKSEKVTKTAQNYAASLQSQVIALESGAQAAEVYAASQAAVINGTESQLPKIIELINRKYELKRAQEALAESNRLEARSIAEIMAKEEERKKQKEADREQAQQGLDAFRESLMSEQQLRAEAFNTELEQLKAARDLKLITQDEFNQLEKDKAQQHASELIAIEQNRVNKELQLEQQKRQAKLALVGDIFGNLASLMNSGSKKLFEIGKASAVAGAIVDGYAAVSKTMASVPYPLNLPLAAAQAAASAVQIKGITSTKFGSAGTGQSFQGGQVVNNVAAQQQQQPQSQQRNISIAVTNGYGSMEDLARSLIPALSEAIGDGTTFDVNGVR